MKLKKIILYTGMALLSLTSCNDYLDVEAPSAYTEEFVFSQKTEIDRALKGVYAQVIVDNLYGNAYQRTFMLNSDVDILISSDSKHSSSSYSRFDCDAQGGEIDKFWTAAYRLIESANKFISSAEKSPLYDKSDREIMQWIGEAKCLRAMVYHDLVVMFGDIPFSFQPSAEREGNFVLPVTDRQEVQDMVINDLKEIAPYMSPASSVTVERCSKEFAQALIARVALTAGGYSLRPDKDRPSSYGAMVRPENWLDYYKTARAYADSVIQAGNHSLRNSYQDVFVKECNYEIVNDDDPIFELPFAKESTGNTGYLQGPEYSANNGETVGVWGECKGNVRLNAFYRLLFRDNDMRREFVNGMWYYTYRNDNGTLVDSVCVRNDYSVHNNKWSKLWMSESLALGKDKAGSTGINFPYMRYADVLLMFAETDNQIEGTPSDKAVDCLQKVHSRAFLNGDQPFIDQAKTSQEAFHKAVMDERKWEFAGENIRWRDLVRTNTYSEELVYSFLRYYSAAMQSAVGMTGYEDAINEHDGKNYIDRLPARLYYHLYNLSELTDPSNPKGQLGLRACAAQLYGNVLQNATVISTYPNQSLQSVRIFNAYDIKTRPSTSMITNFGFSAKEWRTVDLFAWGDNGTGLPKDQCKYSFYGYIRGDDNGNIWIINNGVQEQLPATIPNASRLPVVRYIIPYPNVAIQRSNGAYRNYYGY